MSSNLLEMRSTISVKTGGVAGDTLRILMEKFEFRLSEVGLNRLISISDLGFNDYPSALKPREAAAILISSANFPTSSELHFNFTSSTT